MRGKSAKKLDTLTLKRLSMVAFQRWWSFMHLGVGIVKYVWLLTWLMEVDARPYLGRTWKRICTRQGQGCRCKSWCWCSSWFGNKVWSPRFPRTLFSFIKNSHTRLSSGSPRAQPHQKITTVDGIWLIWPNSSLTRLEWQAKSKRLSQTSPSWTLPTLTKLPLTKKRTFWSSFTHHGADIARFV